MFSWRRFLTLFLLVFCVVLAGYTYWQRQKIRSKLLYVADRLGFDVENVEPTHGKEAQKDPNLVQPDALAAPLMALRLEAEETIRAQMLLRWEQNLGKPIDFSKRFTGHEQLFSPSSIKIVQDALLKEKDPRKIQAHTHLRNDLLKNDVLLQNALLDEEIRSLETDSTLVLFKTQETDRKPDEMFAFHDGLYRLMQEEDDAKRQMIADAFLPVLQEMNPFLEKKIKQNQQTAKALGFSNFIAFCENIQQTSFSTLAQAAQAFLKATEEPYVKLLSFVARAELDRPISELRWCDFPRLLALERFKSYFPKSELQPTFTTILNKLGSDLPRQNIAVYDELTPEKRSRAFCVPIKIPDDIRIAFKPTGGYLDYVSFFHEMGHALHYALSQNDRFEFQYLGSNALREAYAFLFESILEDPAFVSKYTPMPEELQKEFVRSITFVKLFTVRRYAAKLLYELTLYQSIQDNATFDPLNAQAAYQNFLSQAYGIMLNESDALWYLKDMDDFFYVADYLRGWMLAAQLVNFLIYNFGDVWFDLPSGIYIVGFLKLGTEKLPEWISREAGYETLDFERFLHDLNRTVTSMN